MVWLIFICIFILARSIEYLYSKHLLKNKSPLSFSFIRSIFGLAYISLFAFFVDLRIQLPNLLLIYLISILGTAGIYLRTKCIKQFEVSYVTPMLNIVPFFVFIFAVLFLKESLSPAGVIGIFLVTFSVYLLNISKKENIFYPFYQLFKHKRYIIFLPILLFSVTAILDKLTLNSINPLTFIFYLSIFLVINFLILILSVKKLQETKEILVKDYKQYLIIGLLLFISQIGQYFATSLKEISIVNPLLMLSSIIVIVSSRKLFKETDIYMKITSTFILIVGMALILI